ncbi:MAG: hypothetical protein AB2708_01430 [Candidatus Thiodiazotropha taylori]
MNNAERKKPVFAIILLSIPFAVLISFPLFYFVIFALAAILGKQGGSVIGLIGLPITALLAFIIALWLATKLLTSRSNNA